MKIGETEIKKGLKVKYTKQTGTEIDEETGRKVPVFKTFPATIVWINQDDRSNVSNVHVTLDADKKETIIGGVTYSENREVHNTFQLV